MEQQNQVSASEPTAVKPVNKGGVFRWSGLGLLIGFIVGLIFAKITFILFFASIIIFTILGGYYGARTKTPTDKLRELQQYRKDAFINNELLDNREKKLVWIFCFLAPVVCGGVLYYIWRYKYPTKAKQANKISWIAFSIELVLGIALRIAFSSSR